MSVCSTKTLTARETCRDGNVAAFNVWRSLPPRSFAPPEAHKPTEGNFSFDVRGP